MLLYHSFISSRERELVLEREIIWIYQLIQVRQIKFFLVCVHIGCHMLSLQSIMTANKHINETNKLNSPSGYWVNESGLLSFFNARSRSPSHILSTSWYNGSVSSISDMLDSAFCGGGGACEGGGGGAPPGTNAAADADGFHSPALGFILSFKGLGLLVWEMIRKMSSFRTKPRILSYTWKTNRDLCVPHIQIVLQYDYIW